MWRLVYMYIYGYVCIHIYTASRRERLVRELGCWSDKCTRLTPPTSLQTHIPIRKISVEFGFNSSLNFLYNCVNLKLPHATSHHKSNDGLLPCLVLIHMSMTKAYEFQLHHWAPSCPLSPLTLQSPHSECALCVGVQIHHRGQEWCFGCAASAQGSLCEVVYISIINNSFIINNDSIILWSWLVLLRFN